MTIAQENKSEIGQVADLAAEYADRFNISRFVPIDGHKSMNRSSILDPAELRSCFRTSNGLRHSLQQIRDTLRDPLWHVFLQCPVPPPRKLCAWLRRWL